MTSKRKLTKLIFDIVLFLLTLSCIIFFSSFDAVFRKVLSFLLLFISARILYKARFDPPLLVVGGIIFYVNITIAFSDCLSYGQISLPEYTLCWQSIRNTKHEMIFLKCILLFISTVNLFFYNQSSIKTETFIISRKGNIILFSFGYLFLCFGLIFGYNRTSSSTYVSNATALYEYCVLFYLIVWYYAGKSRGRNSLLYLYAALYILQAIYYGDRSSAFPLILLLFLLIVQNLTIKKLIILAICGIFVSNIISVYRTNYSFDGFFDVYASRYGLSSFTSDTVSQSYYTGVTLVYNKSLVNNSSLFFKDFIIGMLLGGDYGNANLTQWGKALTQNKGGGMAVSYFYFWFGYFGVFILGAFIGGILSYLQKDRFVFLKYFKIYFTITTLRWYLYTPFDLFRGVFVVFPIAWSIFMLSNKLIDRRYKKIILSESEKLPLTCNRRKLIYLDL